MTWARLILPLALAAVAASANIVRDVRAAIAKNDFAAAERLVKDQPATPELIEAVSWIGRGALAAKMYDKAEQHAAEARKLSLEALKTRELDDEPRVPIALGAAIEVQAHVMAARGERDQAVEFLRKERDRWRGTSIVTRIQKNINLLSLEGKPAPRIAGVELRGRPALVFLWAHWCGDCKGMAADLARIAREHRDLFVVAPTKLYGYAQRGEDAPPDVETKYIREVWSAHYGELKGVPAPIDEATFRNYGASTTPTIVLIDRAGIVRLYHPGQMTYDELTPLVKAQIGQRSKVVTN